MVQGRRKGSKNKSTGHKAGGARHGAGRPKTKKDAPALQDRLQQPTLRAFSAFVPDATTRPAPAEPFHGTNADSNHSEETVAIPAAAIDGAAQENQEHAAQAREQKKIADAEHNELMRQTMITKLRQAIADGSLESVLECLPPDDEDDMSDGSDDDCDESESAPGTKNPPKRTLLFG